MLIRARRQQIASLALLLGTATGCQAGDAQIDRFVVIQGSATPSEAVVADGDYPLKLGRSEDNGIAFGAATVSRQHATIACVKHRCAIEDVGTDGKGSKNGTTVNGETLTPRKPFALRKGDQISLGPDTKIVAK